MMRRKLSTILLFCCLWGMSSWASAAILIGNTQGDIVLTEFYDYQCPHCHRMSPIVDALIKQNKDLNVALRPVGVLNQISVIEAGLAMVSAMQTPYFMPYHEFLMQNTALSLDELANLAKQMHLTTPQAKTALLSKPVQQELKDNVDTLQHLLANHGGDPDMLQVPLITLQLKDKPQTMTLLTGEVPITVLQDKIDALRGQK